MRKVGGLYFFKLGLFGGSIYLNKPALRITGMNALCIIYGGMAGWYGTELLFTLAGI